MERLTLVSALGVVAQESEVTMPKYGPHPGMETNDSDLYLELGCARRQRHSHYLLGRGRNPI